MNYNKKDIPLIRHRPVVFDTNILIYLFGHILPQNNTLQEVYSSLYKELIINKMKLIITDICILEFVNHIIKKDFRYYCLNNGIAIEQSNEKIFFKQFKNTEEGKESINYIESTIKNKILKYFNLENINIKVENITNSFLYLSKCDFNDLLIASLCKEKNYILCTNDHDFFDLGVDILTENKKL